MTHLPKSILITGLAALCLLVPGNHPGYAQSSINIPASYSPAGIAGTYSANTAGALHAQFSIVPVQDLNFGAFYVGASGGSISILANGSRVVMGDVKEINVGTYPYSPAIFEIDSEPGKLISILNGPGTKLYGNNGNVMGLSIMGAQTVSVKSKNTSKTLVTVGGTLTVNAQQANAAGTYRGSFSITFIQE
jgi:hypothetical protein